MTTVYLVSCDDGTRERIHRYSKILSPTQVAFSAQIALIPCAENFGLDQITFLCME